MKYKFLFIHLQNPVGFREIMASIPSLADVQIIIDQNHVSCSNEILCLTANAVNKFTDLFDEKQQRQLKMVSSFWEVLVFFPVLFRHPSGLCGKNVPCCRTRNSIVSRSISSSN